MEVCYLSFSPEKLKTLHLEHSVTITDSSINHSLRFSTSIISNRQHAADARAFLEANAEVVLFPYPFSPLTTWRSELKFWSLFAFHGLQVYIPPITPETHLIKW